MRHRTRSHTQILIEVGILAIAVAPEAFAQAARSHIFLPPSYGATPISAHINAQANYIAAAGDFLESAANARVTNAQAARMEMDNSVHWVRTYFERKEINREYTRKKSFIERERANNVMIKKLVTSDFEVELEGDVTDKLNWMLRELNARAPAQRFLPNVQDTFVDAPFDVKLGSEEVHHIHMTDGGRANGQLLVFRADANEALDTHWPRALRISDLDVARHRFEWIRDDSVKELRDGGELSDKTARKLMAAVDALCDSFNAAYPPQRRTESMSDYASYLTGKKFVQSLALAVCRTIEAEDQSAFDGSYRFHGHSVAELVGHMHNFGLDFAPAQPGDERVYRNVFFAMRDFYKRVYSQDPDDSSTN